jgi:hypothetical protein
MARSRARSSSWSTISPRVACGRAASIEESYFGGGFDAAEAEWLSSAVLALRDAALRGTLTVAITRAELERVRGAGYRVKLDRLQAGGRTTVDYSGDYQLVVTELPIDLAAAAVERIDLEFCDPPRPLAAADPRSALRGRRELDPSLLRSRAGAGDGCQSMNSPNAAKVAVPPATSGPSTATAPKLATSETAPQRRLSQLIHGGHARVRKATQAKLAIIIAGSISQTPSASPLKSESALVTASLP